MGRDGCGGGTAKHNLERRDSHLELNWLGNGFVIHLPKETMALVVGAQLLTKTPDLIPTVIDQNPCAHLRMPRDMIFHGWSMRLFQAWQHSATMSS